MTNDEMELVRQATGFLMCTSGFALILVVIAELLDFIAIKDEEKRNSDQ